MVTIVSIVAVVAIVILFLNNQFSVVLSNFSVYSVVNQTQSHTHTNRQLYGLVSNRTTLSIF